MFIKEKYNSLPSLKLRQTLAADRSVGRSIFTFMLIAVALCLSESRPVHAVPMDPFSYFNVYSLGNINYTGSDFEGKAGAAGNVSLSSFSLALKDQGGYALHAGGTVTLNNGSFYGGIEAKNNIAVGGIGIYGDVHGGANVGNTSGGTINGNVYAAGSANLTQSITYYSKSSGAPYSPEADLAAISGYFADFSTMVGGMSNTGAISSSYGTLTLSALSGVNVFSLSAADMFAASVVNITGASDSTVYINVTGTAASLNSTTWKYYEGILSDDVLLNYADAATLALSSANNVNILAPFADTNYTSGVVTGNLIVGNLTGRGQVNLGHFGHGPQIAAVPEPATILLLCTGLAGLFGLRRSARFVAPPRRRERGAVTAIC